MTVFNATVHTDYYKTFHKMAYHPAITKVYSNFTSRNGKLSNVPSGAEVVFVGLQYFIKDFLINEWNETFFNLPKEKAISNIKRYVDSAIGVSYDASHFEALHDLGYLPLQVKALPEGSLVPYGVSPVTFTNTVEGFQWLPNYLETVFSNENWPIQTSATTSFAYLKNTVGAFKRAGLALDLVPFMCHDFSARGMFGRQAAAMSGFGHLCSFAGTDTISALAFAEKYYNANVDTELVGASCAATEHSTTTSFILSLVEEKGISKLGAEIDYVRYLMSVVPTGILSHVSDSFDFWKFVTEGLPALKDEILARNGKLVIRPDSGDPVKVLTGDENSTNEAERKGLIECLWDIFGGSLSPTGLKLLHDNIGAIFGDSITLERQQQIIERLEAKGFAGVVVLGVGSYSYQYVTRDTHSSAVKTTYVEKDGKGVNVFKDPATDSKKKSACGLLRIERVDGKLVQYDQQTREQEQQGLLEVVFEDGKLVKETSLAEIRKLVREQLDQM
jgi:nicotinamide phosphoribosyltransferase